MVPASAYLGFTASIIWVGEVRMHFCFSVMLNCWIICVGKSETGYNLIMDHQGTYLTSAARIHASENKLHEGTVIGNFNGEFWAFFALHQVIFWMISGYLYTIRIVFHVLIFLNIYLSFDFAFFLKCGSLLGISLHLQCSKMGRYANFLSLCDVAFYFLSSC